MDNWITFPALNIDTDKQLQTIENMLHSPVKNYIAPGLISYLVGGMHSPHSAPRVASDPVRPTGSTRMFHMTRDQDYFVVPHSHRFDFSCFVLTGDVTNYLYTPSKDGEEYIVTRYPGDLTPYHTKFTRQGFHYQQGAWYHMLRDEFHSIVFSKGAKVLFLEGGDQRTWSEYLEPVVDGQHVNTFRIESWMFLK